MSQWSKVQQNPFVLRQMQTFYQAHFPIEVRYYLCQWIEEQQWDQIDETLPEHQPIAASLVQTMLQLLGEKVAQLSSPDLFVTRLQLQQSLQDLESMASINPLDLVHVIKNCLRNEQRLIEQAELAEQQQEQLNQELMAPQPTNVCNQIRSDTHAIMQKTKETESLSKQSQSKQEAFIISFSEGQQIDIQLNGLQNTPNSAAKTERENELKAEKTKVAQSQTQLASELLHLRIILGRKFEETIAAMQILQKQISDNELMSWKRRQQLSGNGLVVDSSSLDILQGWCEDLADLIWQNRQQIKKLQTLQKQLPIKFPDGEVDRLPKLTEDITTLLSSLVTSTFIVEQQPPQVLKKGSRFGAVVRLLVGGKLSVHMNPPTVLATIISSSQAEKLLLNNDVQAKADSGDILNNTGTMEYTTSTGHLSINLRNMTLKKIKRNGKKGTEVVTEEKFCVLFQSEFRMGGDELAFHVWTLSLPVVVTVHGTQECNALATILWDNAFAEPGRFPFVVPDQVGWHQLAEQLNMRFQSSTGRGLSDTNLAYIASKLCGTKDPSKCSVTWAQFNKETLPSKPFTFWEWFYSMEKLTKEHLKDLWMHDAIIGFVSKVEAKSWLLSSPPGTFLLRFSDSKLGGISVAWLEGTEVRHLAPSGSKEFQSRSMADRIKDMDTVTRLYPNKDKNEVFSKYYTHNTDSATPNEDGYVEPEMKSIIPKLNSSSPEDHLLGMPFSPDTIYGSPCSVATPQTDAILDDTSSFSPIVDSIAEMDINSFTDYMPEDIQGMDMQHLNLAFNLPMDVYSQDPNLAQNAIAQSTIPTHLQSL